MRSTPQQQTETEAICLHTDVRDDKSLRLTRKKEKRSLKMFEVYRHAYHIVSLHCLCLNADLSDLSHRVALAKQRLTLLPRPGGHQ